MNRAPTRDRQIQKTDALLRGALAELIREKPYDDIVVKEILGRANVGRSTFYTHFSDKDELLLSCIHEMLRPATPREGILWFSLPVFEHIERHRDAGKADSAPQEPQAMHQQLEWAIAELIEDEFRVAFRSAGAAIQHAPPELVAQWIASTFVMVLNWWVNSDNSLPARDADGVFRALVRPAFAEAFR